MALVLYGLPWVSPEASWLRHYLRHVGLIEWERQQGCSESHWPDLWIQHMETITTGASFAPTASRQGAPKLDLLWSDEEILLSAKL